MSRAPECRRRLRRALAALIVLSLSARPPVRLSAQALPASRLWRPDERTLITDLSVVTAIAASRSVVYAATAGALAIYDRGLRNLLEVVSVLDGYPQSPVLAMAADPNDNTAWLGGRGYWMRYDPFGRRFDGGALPGDVIEVAVDATNPSRGAYFRVAAGWYVVDRGAVAAYPARDVPPPGNRIGSMSYAQLVARLPAFDAVRLRLERDEQQRSWRLTSATQAPLTNEIFVGTDGNGAFRVDPLTYGTERLPVGLAGGSAGAVAAWRGNVCVVADARVQSARRGITCLDDRLGSFTSVERAGFGGLPGVAVRALLVTERAVWVATDQGVVRAPRRGGRISQVAVRDGLPSDQVYSLAAADEGAWVGTANGLALVADTGRTTVVIGRAEGPPVLAMAPPAADTLWAGTSSGIVGFLLPIGGPVVLPDGPMAIHDPVVSLAARGDTLVATTATRLLLRAGGAWSVSDPPGSPIGELERIVPDLRSGYWVAGTQGFAWFEPRRNAWTALVSPADVPLPVRDVAATRDYVWVATDVGLVRYERRVLVP